MKINIKPVLKYILGLGFMVPFLSCAQPGQVKTDLKSLTESTEMVQVKEVVVTTDIKRLNENPEFYLERKIELKGYVRSDSRKDIYWHFYLSDEEGRKVKCYERNYRISAWSVAVHAISRAEKNSDQICVMGHFQMGMKIELSWIEYEGRRINTNFKPKERPARIL